MNSRVTGELDGTVGPRSGGEMWVVVALSLGTDLSPPTEQGCGGNEIYEVWLRWTIPSVSGLPGEIQHLMAKEIHLKIHAVVGKALVVMLQKKERHKLQDMIDWDKENSE